MGEARPGLRVGLSPQQAARLWLKSGTKIKHAIVEVIFWTPNRAAKSGYELGVRVFYLAKGNLAAAHSTPGAGFGKDRENGLCWACGSIYDQPVVGCYSVRDPEAGKILNASERGQIADPDAVVLRAWNSYTMACPSCVLEHGLTTEGAELHAHSDPLTGKRLQPRAHPTLAKFRNKPPVRVRLDMRPWQRAISDEIEISIAIFGSPIAEQVATLPRFISLEVE